MPAVADAQRGGSRASRSGGREQRVEAGGGTEEPDQRKGSEREKNEVVEEFWEWNTAKTSIIVDRCQEPEPRVSLHHARNMQEGGKN